MRAWFRAEILGLDALDSPKSLGLSRSAGRYLQRLLSGLDGKPGVPHSRGVRLTGADALDILAALRGLTNLMLLNGHKAAAGQLRAEAKEVWRHLLGEHPSPGTRARARG